MPALPASQAGAGVEMPARPADMRRPAGLPDDEFLRGDTLRHTFEAMLLEATAAGEPDKSGGASTPALLKQRLGALLPRHFPAPLLARAAALLERYVDYRVALGTLAAPADPGDPRALRQTLEARQRLRERYFSDDEATALFAKEAELDRFTLARLEVERHTGLTPAQKQLALRDIEGELSDTERSARAAAVAHVAVAAQTTAFDAQGTSDQVRHAQRRDQYGEAAARQLAANDREERDWQARLGRYASAVAAKTEARQLLELRQLLFTAQEALRVEPALAVPAMPAAAR